MTPIFIGATRSFWATVAGFMAMLEAGEEVIRSSMFLAAPLLALLGISPEAAGTWLVQAAPFMLWAFALQQRSGNARPYTIDPRAIR